MGLYRNRDSGRSVGKTRRKRGLMKTIRCSQCGRKDKVPFIPEGDKPVYCRSCLKKIRGR